MATVVARYDCWLAALGSDGSRWNLHLGLKLGRIQAGVSISNLPRFRLRLQSDALCNHALTLHLQLSARFGETFILLSTERVEVVFRHLLGLLISFN